MSEWQLSGASIFWGLVGLACFAERLKAFPLLTLDERGAGPDRGDTEACLGLRLRVLASSCTCREHLPDRLAGCFPRHMVNYCAPADFFRQQSGTSALLVE